MQQHQQSRYQEMLHQEQFWNMQVVLRLTVLLIILVGIAGFFWTMQWSAIGGPLIFLAGYAVLLFLLWYIGYPAYKYAQAQSYTRREEEWLMYQPKTPTDNGYAWNDRPMTIGEPFSSSYNDGYQPVGSHHLSSPL